MSAKKQVSLFKFFGTPTSSKASPNSEKQQNVQNTPKSSKRPLFKSNDEKNNDEDEAKSRGKVRKREPTSSPSSFEEDVSDGEEYKPPKKTRKRILLQSDSSSSSENESYSSNDDATPKKSKAKRKSNLQTKFERTPGTPSSRKETNPEPVMPHVAARQNFTERKQHLHETLPFLQKDQIRDKYKRRPTDPDYDPTTLYVPPDYLKSLTAAVRQWWEIKSDHFDCVIFFKLGKFYELYHMDAVVGVEELGFSYMRGNFAHSGFPESAYGRMAASLIQKGYKVARVEQTESVQQMQERAKSTKDKVVRREICQITTKATQVYNSQDAPPAGHEACHLMAIYELNESQSSQDEKCKFGVCFVETSMGRFYFGQFNDDMHRSALHLLLARYPPAMVLICRNNLSDATQKLFKSSQLLGVAKEILKPKTEFMSPENVIKMIQEKKYFHDQNGQISWPAGLKQMLDGDGMIAEPLDEYKLAFMSFGAILYYLQYSLIDDQLLGMKSFSLYHAELDTENFVGEAMILDAITLYNLRIVDVEGSLFSKIDFCKTPFGKRLLRQWLTSPLCNVEKIIERQQAVEELLNICCREEIQKLLKNLPDLERMVSRFHGYGNKKRATTHPDSRAVFFEEKTYSKRKIKEFVILLESFDKVLDIVSNFEGVKSSLLRQCTVDDFPDISEPLNFFRNAFNHTEAKTNGTITPSRDLDENYSQVLDDIDDINRKLESYRKEQEKVFGCSISYFGVDKKRFQLAIPLKHCHKVDRGYSLESSKKGKDPVNRYWTETTRKYLVEMQAAEERKRIILQDSLRVLFEKFSHWHERWIKATNCIAILDVLLSLAEYQKTGIHDMVIPEVCKSSDRSPFIEIEEGRHPCIGMNENFVPNDTKLGIDDEKSLMILTGPNMGGKSTLMRQVALLSILAQMGSFVPANKCRLSVIDRIFTRTGARDDIAQGDSTFMIELKETNSILKYATRNSLAVIDELGRGTSTYDGAAIAGGVVDYLAQKGMRTIFATHHFHLNAIFVDHPKITFGHMATFVETREFLNEEKMAFDSVVFLYKLTEGPCSKSYGFSVAELAGLDSQIVNRGAQIANECEKNFAVTSIFKEFISLNDDNCDEIKFFIKKLRKLNLQD